MSEQLFFVSRGRTIRGPVTNRKKIVQNGQTKFVGESGRVYGPFDAQGNPTPLPSGFVAYARDKKESNGHTLLENLIADGSIVFEAGGQSPVEFAKPMSVNLTANGGVVTEDPKGGK